MKPAKLKEVIASIITGEWGVEGNTVQVLRTTNFRNDGSLNFENVVCRDIKRDIIEKKKLRVGDIIIEKSGGGPKQPVGRVVYYNNSDAEYLCNNFTSILRPSKVVNSRYLFYFMHNQHSLGVTQKFQNKTTGIINLKLDNYLTNITIPLPPLDQQIRIAKILDTADALRQKDKELLATYDELLKATFLDMFGDTVVNPKGWKKVKIEKVCTEIVDCVNKTAPYVEYITDYKMIRTSNVRNYEVNLDDVRCVEKNIFEKWNRRLTPQRGDIVFTREAPMGEAGILLSNEKVFLGQRTMIFRVNDKFTNNYFLLFQLMGDGIKNQINKLCMGSTVQHLSVPACNKLEILLPPISLQNQFAQIVTNIEAQKTLAKQNLQQSEEIFNALVQKAFNGQL